jgi:hypothetical protein
MRPSAGIARAGVVLVALAMSACGKDESPGTTAATVPQPKAAPQATQVEPAHCPASAGNCEEAGGRVLYVEAHDPDGDGDAHLVLASRDSITGPGISVIDVEKALRPHPLPAPGVEVSAAGPVYPGSYGQHQIQASELNLPTD